jgi:group I intron endonuclease
MIITIYKHTNRAVVNGKENGMVYIGQTSKTMMKRWNKGNGYYTNKHFHAAIKKYGKENFSHEVITFCGTQETADYLEQYFIAKYNSANNKKGYNKDLGGNGSRKRSEETKAKISASHQGKTNSEKCRQAIKIGLSKMSDEDKIEMRRNLSIAIKGKPKSKEHNLKNAEAHKDKTHSEESKQKISKSKQGQKAHNKIEWTEEQMKEILDLSISANQLEKKYNHCRSIFLRIRKHHKERMK